jgi:hypothetical protein
MCRSYWLLWLGQTISRFGDGFFFIAVSWLVYADTGSALALGVLWMARSSRHRSSGPSPRRGPTGSTAAG